MSRRWRGAPEIRFPHRTKRVEEDRQVAAAPRDPREHGLVRFRRHVGGPIARDEGAVRRVVDGVEAQSALVEESGARPVAPARGVGPPQSQRAVRRGRRAGDELDVEVVGPHGARIVFC